VKLRRIISWRAIECRSIDRSSVGGDAKYKVIKTERMLPVAKGDGPLLRMELRVLDIITKFPPPKPFDGVTNTVAAAM